MSELKRVHIFLPRRTYEQLKVYAEKHGYANTSELIREIIREWFSNRGGNE